MAKTDPKTAARIPGVHLLGDSAPEVRRRLRAYQAGDVGAVGFPAPWGALNQVIGGLGRGEMTVIASRSGVGKTVLALNLARYLAVDRGVPILWLSLESDRVTLGENLVLIHGRLSGTRLHRGLLNQSESERADAAMKAIGSAPFRLLSTAQLTLPQLRRAAKHAVLQNGVKCIFIDYLQLVSASQPTATERCKAVEISRTCKLLAGELDIPLVCLSQLNLTAAGRECGDEPVLADLGEWEALEQDADVVWLLHRPGHCERGGDETVAYVEIAKNRRGPAGRVDLRFTPETLRFEEAGSGEIPAN